MLYTVVGVLGFVGFLLFDIFSMKNKPLLKYVFLLLGLVLIVFGTIGLIGIPQDMIIPDFMRIGGAILGILFILLLIYSVFIEVGLNTYQKYAQPELVTNGTYSLVRHPGVIWLFLAYFFASMFYANSFLLITAFIWTAFNTAYIIIQERFILIKLFQNYEEYRLTTPMIIPNVSSIKRFMTLDNWRKQ